MALGKSSHSSLPRQGSIFAWLLGTNLLWKRLPLKSVWVVLYIYVIQPANPSAPENKYLGISTRIHSIDFSILDEAAYNSLSKALGDLNVGILGKLLFNCSKGQPIDFCSEQRWQVAYNASIFQ